MSFLARHRKLFFVLVMMILSLILTALLLVVLDALGQRFFFDKLYYRKSVRHGYVSEIRELTQTSPLLMGNRVRDVQDLIQGKSTPSPKQFTVALIGDSMMYGEGVLEEQRFAHLLEEQLNKLRPTRVYVLALPGDHALDNYAKFLLAEKTINADVYVFGLMNNDLLFEPQDTYPGEPQLFEWVKLACAAPMYSATVRLDMSWETLVKEVYPPSFSEQYGNLCLVQQFAKEVASRKAKALTLTFFNTPRKAQFTSEMTEMQRTEAEQLEIYANMFRDQGIKNILPHDDPDFGYEPVSPLEGHPSASTHAKYSQYLYQELVGSPEWGFTR
jgi:hypothetical protein